MAEAAKRWSGAVARTAHIGCDSPLREQAMWGLQRATTRRARQREIFSMRRKAQIIHSQTMRLIGAAQATTARTFYLRKQLSLSG